MKKKEIKNKVADLRIRVKNAFADSTATDLRDALLELLDAVEAAAEDVSFDELETQIIGIIKKMKAEDVPDAVADAISKTVGLKLKEVQNSIKPHDALTKKIKNEIAYAILSTANRNNRVSAEDAVNAILTKNGITGLTFADVIDYNIETKWEDLNPIWQQLNHTFLTKFFYTEDEQTSAATFAKGWQKTNTGEKVIQQITTTPKEIITKLNYKIQELAQEDIMKIQNRARDNWSQLLNWMNTELDKQLVNSKVITLLVGDHANDAANRIRSFEPIAAQFSPDGANPFPIKTASDNWTSIKEVTTENPSVTDIRVMCDMIHNPNGKKTMLVMDKRLLTELSAFRYAGSGDVSYRPIEVMAGEFGVDEIYTTDMLGILPTLKALVFIPSEYNVCNEGNIAVDYPKWEVNRQAFQRETLDGGAIRGLLSSAICVSSYTPAP